MVDTITSKKYSIKQIFEEHWDEFLNIHSKTPKYILAEAKKMLNCRNPQKLGYHKYICPDHPNEYTIVPHSCKGRLCSVCGTHQTDRWMNDIMNKFPDTGYYHVTLTLPDYLWYFFQDEARRPLLDLVFKSARETILGWFLQRGIKPAMVIVMHTFGKKINFNVHIHLIVSAGGLKIATMKKDVEKAIDGYVWKAAKLHYETIRKRWRAIVLNKLKKYLIEYAPDGSFKELLQKIKYWYINAGKRSDPVVTCRYIGRYAKRPAMAQTRITNYDKQNVTFYYETLQPGGWKKKEYLTLFWEEFIKRLIQHIPLPNFRMVRRYGLLANKTSKNLLQIAFQLLGQNQKKTTAWPSWRQRQIKYLKRDPLKCTTCNKEMILEEIAFWSKKMAGLYIKGIGKAHTENFQGWIALKMQFSMPFSHFLDFLESLNTNFLQNLRFYLFQKSEIFVKN